MRALLIVLGSLIVATVAFVVAWPRLVDEPAIRDQLRRIVQGASGQELRMLGRVELILLPTPRISIEQVAWGNGVAAAPVAWLEADRVDIELAPLPLLAGRLQPSRLRLVRPSLDIVGEPAALADLFRRAAATPNLSELTRVSIVDGRLNLGATAAGALPPVMEAMELDIVRGPDDGRLELRGGARVADELVTLRFEAAPFALDAPMSLDLEVMGGEQGATARLAFQGTFRPDLATPRLEGVLSLASAPDGTWPFWLGVTSAGGEAVLPVLGPASLSGRLAWTRDEALRVQDLELVLAGNELRGGLDLTLGAAPHLELALDGREATLAPELENRLRAVNAAVIPEHWTGRIALRLQTAAWRGEQIRRLRADIALAAGRKLTVEQLEATLPGETALNWRGRAGSTPERPFAGHLDLSSAEPRRLLAWLGADTAALPGDGIRSFSLQAEVDAAPADIRLSGLDARLDATHLTGSMALVLDTRPHLALALAADRINLDLYRPDEGALRDLRHWRDWLQRIDVAADVGVGRLSHGSLRAEDVQARGAIEDGQLTLEDLRIGSLAGAGLHLVGSADLEGGRYDLAADLAVPQPKLLLRLFGIEPPPALDRLAPIRVAGTARGDSAMVSIDGDMVGAGVEVALDGTLGRPFDTSRVDLSAQLRAGEAGHLFEALGWVRPADQEPLGPLETRLQIRRDGAPADLTLDSSIGAARLAGRVRAEFGAGRSRLGGEVTAAAFDVALLAGLYDMLAVPLAFPAGSPWAWPGAWPRRPLGWQWLDAVELELGLDMQRFRRGPVVLPDGHARILLEDGRLELRDLAVPLAGGMLTGVVTLDGQGSSAALGTELELRAARAEQLVQRLARGSVLAGDLSLSARLQGAGRSIADIVTSLAGEGRIELQQAQIGMALGEAVQPPAGSAPLSRLDSLVGPFTVSRGIVASGPAGLALAYPDGTARLDLSLDLLAWVLDLRLAMPEAANGPANLRFIGAPGRLRPVPPPQAAAP